MTLVEYSKMYNNDLSYLNVTWSIGTKEVAVDSFLGKWNRKIIADMPRVAWLRSRSRSLTITTISVRSRHHAIELALNKPYSIPLGH